MAHSKVQFKKATKRQSKLRLAITGPSGAGKTYTALKIARELVGPDGKIALIDTESGSASLYSDEFEFDVVELNDFHPQNFIDAILAAEEAGYDLCIIDSMTHEWSGPGGVLEIVDRSAKGGNKWSGWATGTPLHNRFIETIIRSKMHIIATMRSKMETANEGGKIVKLGMNSIQRDGMEYEFTVVLDMDQNNYGTITKTRCSVLTGKAWRHPGKEIASILNTWLESGEAADVQALSDTVSLIKTAYQNAKDLGIDALPDLPDDATLRSMTDDQQQKTLRILNNKIQKFEHAA